MAVYYNEVDADAAEWLRQLIKEGAIEFIAATMEALKEGC